MSQQPPTQSRTQVEFGPEENRTFAALAANMSTVATLMSLVGLAFLIFFGLLLWQAIDGHKSSYATVVALGTATLLCLTIGFQTYSAAGSFRRVVETQSRDVWHLMNALESLRGMYGLMRLIILTAIVLLIVAAVLWTVLKPTV